MRVPSLSIGIAAGVLLLAAAPPRPIDAASSKLRVQRKALAPRAVSGSGGDVWIAVNVSRTGGVISNVQVRASIPGGSAVLTPLTRARGPRYQGYCRVPRNGRLQSATASIVLVVSTPEGPEERRIGQVKIGPGDDSVPPPPPAD